jgi:histidinol dehydrogenase
VPLRLDASAPGFEKEFSAFLGRNRDTDENVDRVVAGIVADVRARGDAAVVDYTARFDWVGIAAANMRISDAERDAAAAQVPAAQREALIFAARRIEAFHRALMPKDVEFTDATGTRLGARYRPVDAAGVYVPGGTAAYPSSVLMNIVPAKVAGVGRIVMVVPTPGGTLNPLVMLAAAIAGADEIWRIGGAQAVAALAYGTESIRPVDKITGPGNAYVAAAKRRVFGQVGIDLIAGPSEILVVADRHNDPAWIAADLLSQAEHDTAAQSILITDDAGFAARVEAEVDAPDDGRDVEAEPVGELVAEVSTQEADLLRPDTRADVQRQGHTLAAVVGDVESAAFKNKAGTQTNETLHRPGTVFLGAIRQVRVLHGLAHLELVSAGLAFVIVSGHGLICEK